MRTIYVIILIGLTLLNQTINDNEHINNWGRDPVLINW